MTPPGPPTRAGAPPRPRPGPAAHPRIRARRVEVARDLGRRRRRRLNVVLGLVCIGVWSLVVLRSSLLDVDRLQISGSAQTPTADIEATLGAGVGQPMTDVDPSGTADRLEALPWVAEARVSRMWPGTVRVVLVERAAVATVAHPAGWALLDADGRILATTAVQPADLAVLAGERTGAPGATVAAADREVLAVLDQLPGAFRDEVVGAIRGGDGVALELVEGPCVVLGDASALAAKVTAADAVRHRLDDASGARLDVRVPSAPALTRDARCA